MNARFVLVKRVEHDLSVTVRLVGQFDLGKRYRFLHPVRSKIWALRMYVNRIRRSHFRLPTWHPFSVHVLPPDVNSFQANFISPVSPVSRIRFFLRGGIAREPERELETESIRPVLARRGATIRDQFAENGIETLRYVRLPRRLSTHREIVLRKLLQLERSLRRVQRG